MRLVATFHIGGTFYRLNVDPDPRPVAGIPDRALGVVIEYKPPGGDGRWNPHPLYAGTASPGPALIGLAALARQLATQWPAGTVIDLGDLSPWKVGRAELGGEAG